LLARLTAKMKQLSGGWLKVHPVCRMGENHETFC
jgi:hypothetical protein